VRDRATLDTAYTAATEQVRRLLNQALYRQVFISHDGVVRVVYTDGFDWLLGRRTKSAERRSRGRSRAALTLRSP
jgi:hypothetical protein